ncbi:hypothetical protein T492DRAFT_430271 [Pavlovales sp. CCMP2436]|nr:hypothetical protein T492DRAFT_430271 [Pavlovales sp. CCMP2436]
MTTSPLSAILRFSSTSISNCSWTTACSRARRSTRHARASVAISTKELAVPASPAWGALACWSRSMMSPYHCHSGTAWRRAIHASAPLRELRGPPDRAPAARAAYVTPCCGVAVAELANWAPLLGELLVYSKGAGAAGSSMSAGMAAPPVCAGSSSPSVSSGVLSSSSTKPLSRSSL